VKYEGMKKKEVEDEKNAMGKVKNIKRIFVFLMIMGIIANLAPAVHAGQTVLWVVPDNPDRYDMSSETVIDDVDMGTTFSGNIIVLNHAPSQSSNVAQEVYLKFFVYDASTIESITIGTAERIQPLTTPFPTIVKPNPDSDSSAKTFDAPIPSVSTDPPYPAGYGVQYLIGDIPWHGNTDAVGNPQDDINTFNPDAADCYIRVPFTINFKTTPYAGFTLYIYAENDETDVKTAYSHDGGITHVPEFSTIAIPVAAIFGLLFFFNHRKRRAAN
jgi:hypothetical protein